MNKLLSALTLCGLTLLFNCSNPLASKANGTLGIVTIRLGAGLEKSRTLVPDILQAADSVVLKLSSTQGFESRTKTVTNSTSASFENLEAGTWTITATAFLNETAIAEGTLADHYLAPGANSYVTLSLAPLGTANGSISLVLTVPFASQVDSLDWSLEKDGQVLAGFAPSNLSLVSNGYGNTATISASEVPAGSYTLVMSFKHGTDPEGSFREAVNIYPGLVSDKWLSWNSDTSTLELEDHKAFNTNDFASSNSGYASFFVEGSAVPATSSSSPYSTGYLPGTTSISISATEAVPGQSIQFTWNGSQAQGLESGVDTAPLALAKGINVLILTITAANASSSTSYTVHIPYNPVFTSSSIISMQMVEVPAGSFLRDSSPANSSFVDSFLLGKYEVTREQFQNLFGNDPSTPAYSSGTSDPVQNVNWYMAIAFCNKLSLLEGLEPVYSVTGVDFASLTYAQIPLIFSASWDTPSISLTSKGYRLPSEMEWMWAAMGATNDRANGYTGTGLNTTGYNKGYAGSSEAGLSQSYIGSYAWTSENSLNKTRPVGSNSANELGIYDMSGNVWEWNWDYFALGYPYGALYDYRGPIILGSRSGHGGSWSDPQSNATLAKRGYNASNYRDSYWGFRVARSTSSASRTLYFNDFESLSTADLEGQDGWTSTLYSVNASMRVTSSSVAPNTSQIAHNEWGSAAGDGASASKTLGINFSASKKYILMADIYLNAWSNIVGIGYDKNGNGKISRDDPFENEVAIGMNAWNDGGQPTLGIYLPNRNLPLKTIVPGYTAGNWVRCIIEIDNPNNRFSAYCQNLSVPSGVTTLYTNQPLGLANVTADRRNPVYWDYLYMHFEHAGMADNIKILEIQ